MNKSNLVSAVIALVVALIVVGLFGGSSSRSLFGGRVETVLNEFAGGVKIVGGGLLLNDAAQGASGVGSTYKFVKSGTCAILSNASVAASTTKNFDCSFSGARSGDLVFVHLTASSSLASQYLIKGYQASSTADWITFSIYNATGGSAVPSATVGFGSSTAVQIWRTQ